MAVNGGEVAPAVWRSNGAPGELWRELTLSLRNPEFWALSSWLDIIVRARRSKLGMLWLLAPSIVYVFGLGGFFAGMQGDRENGFFLHVALGAMVFRTLMASVISSSTVFNSNLSFIMDGHMRLTDYLLESLAKSFFDMLMYLPVTIVAMVLYGDVHAAGLLVALPMLVIIYLNALWIVTVFSLVGARFSDFGQLLGNVAIFLFLLTPIVWYADRVPQYGLRAHLMRLNPFYHFVELFRAPIMGSPVDLGSVYYVAAMTVLGLLVATFAYRRYARYVPLWI